MLLAESELREMAVLAAAAGVEMSLFVGPREGYGVGAHPRSADGAGHAGADPRHARALPTRSRTSRARPRRASAASSSPTWAC